MWSPRRDSMDGSPGSLGRFVVVQVGLPFLLGGMYRPRNLEAEETTSHGHDRQARRRVALRLPTPRGARARNRVGAHRGEPRNRRRLPVLLEHLGLSATE